MLSAESFVVRFAVQLRYLLILCPVTISRNDFALLIRFGALEKDSKGRKTKKERIVVSSASN